MEANELLDKLLFDYKGKLEVSFDDEDENIGYLTDCESGETFSIAVCKVSEGV